MPHRFRLRLLAGLLAAASIACQGEGPPPDTAPPRAPEHADLRQALSVVRELSAREGGNVTTFLATGDDHSAGAYVDFFFSPMGSRDWPPVAGGVEDMGNLAGWSRAAGLSLLPASVRLVAWDPDPDAGRQLVVWADDDTGSLGASGFVSPDSAAVFEVRWPFAVR